MKGVKLSERIRYIHCEDPDGNHGVLVLLGAYGYPTKAVDIEDQTDMRFWLDGFRRIESRQKDKFRLPALV